jgi:tetratricopeptide (TPR) repeat protein
MAGVYAHRGLAYQEKGELDRAADDLTRAVELDPKEAIAHLQEFLEKRPQDDDQCLCCFFLAMAHWKAEQKEEARRYWDKAITSMNEHHPDDERLTLVRNEAKRVLEIEEQPAEKQGEAQPEASKAEASE